MRKLATLAGISSGTVSELEHRVIQPTLATMLILQQVFELSSIEELLGELPDTPRLPSAELGALSNRAIRSA